jgi:hypothetical protein
VSLRAGYFSANPWPFRETRPLRRSTKLTRAAGTVLSGSKIGATVSAKARALHSSLFPPRHLGDDTSRWPACGPLRGSCQPGRFAQVFQPSGGLFAPASDSRPLGRVRPGSPAPFASVKSPTSAAAARHRSAMRSRDEAPPWIPPIQSPSSSYQISRKTAKPNATY